MTKEAEPTVDELIKDVDVDEHESTDTDSKSAPDKNWVYMATILSIYKTKDNTSRQRHLNVMVESPSINITRLELESFQHATLERLNKENGVEAEDILDIVIVSICTLGHMTSEEFQAEDALDSVDENSKAN